MSRGPELTDAQWARIEPLMPAQKGPMGPPFRPHRLILEGIVHRYRTGIPWRDLPAKYGSWQTAHRRHQQWSKDGTYDAIMAAIQAQADAAGQIDWRLSVDSTIARVHQHGATASRARADLEVSASASSHTRGGTDRHPC
jgi:transposase